MAAKQGDALSPSMKLEPLKLGKLLSRGGQGSVFAVEGQPWVVKLYHTSLLSGPRREEQSRRLSSMVKEGAPSTAFVWPIDVIEHPNLGYVMPRLPAEYVSLAKLNWDASSLDWVLRLRMCFRLAQAFAALHLRRGYAYCDLSGTNVFCNPSTGDVRIIDADNLTVDGEKSALGILGTPRYMAPELQCRGIQDPNIQTDIHSLAVLIFETLLLHHPLLGDRVLGGPPELEDAALGANTVYIYHPQDKSNRYTKYREFGGLPPKVLPELLMLLFEETFTHGVLQPRLRVRETRWQRALVDSLDTMIPCGSRRCLFKGTFFNGKSETSTCTGCGSPLRDFGVIQFLGQRHEVSGTKVLTGREWLAAHHCKFGQQFNFSPESACGKVEKDPVHGLTLLNVGKEAFLYKRPGTDSYAVFPPAKRIALRVGTEVQFGASGREARVVA